MFKMLDKVIVKKNKKEGIVIGIAPVRIFMPILQSGYKYLVLFDDKPRWIKEDKLTLKE